MRLWCGCVYFFQFTWILCCTWCCLQSVCIQNLTVLENIAQIKILQDSTNERTQSFYVQAYCGFYPKSNNKNKNKTKRTYFARFFFFLKQTAAQIQDVRIAAAIADAIAIIRQSARCFSEAKKASMYSQISISRTRIIRILRISKRIKNTFWLLSSTIIWRLGLFYKLKIPEVQDHCTSGIFSS